MEVLEREDLKKQTTQSRWNRVRRVLIPIVRIIPTVRMMRGSQRLEFLSLIDESSSDKVYKVGDRLSGETYALKEFHGISYSEKISREIEILKKLNNPNLVKCYQIFHVDNKIFLLLEPLDRGSLAGIKFTSEFDLARLGHQVLLGLRYLHQNNIWHGDIKPSNMFVNHLEQVKILFPGRILSNIRSNAMGDIHDRFSWDIWSVGSCILKLSKGLNWSSIEFKFNEVIGSQNVPTSSQHKGAVAQKPSAELWRFLLCCMKTERDKAKRQRADELIRHPFFEQLSLKKRMDFNQFYPAAASFEKESSFISDAELSEVSTSEGEEQINPRKKKSRTFGEDQIIPRKKKSRTFVKDESNEYDGRSHDPTRRHTHFHRGIEHCTQRRIEHCTLFLPDGEFEKDKLVQMWIAEDCIELELTNRMEDLANSYFDALVDEEFIVPSKFYNVYRRMKYKLNAAKASALSFKGGNYVRIDSGNSDEICEVVLHLTWQCKTLDRALSDALKNLKQLRTLVMIEDCSGLIKQLPNDIFLGLKLLRTLDLSRTHISELPGSIRSLESLRYLDISETPIKRLPESVDRLSLLQTLKLKGCFGLSVLPRGLGRLTNLRHLDLDVVSQLKYMPREMGNLIKLQTLQAFLVGKNNRCGLGELKNMNEITGSFCLSMLENVSNAEEAKEAALGDKKHIEKLELRWHDHVSEDSQDTADILEYLQPHFQLRELQLTFYRGSKLPSWISNPSFTDLASITLYKCINCDILPSIGELPSLKILHIVDMNNVKNIGTLFCRNDGSQGFNAFPRLEKLTLDNMLNLEEWTGIEDGDFPCIQHVSIRYCPKLYVLPSLSHLYSLQHLEICHCMQLISLPEGLLPGSLDSLIIRGCPKVNERCMKDGGLDWFKIASVQNIWIDFEKICLDDSCEEQYFSVSL